VSVPGKWFLENAQFDEKGHQVASGDVIHHKIQIVFILHANEWRKETIQLLGQLHSVEQIRNTWNE
jgi:hypothetical protein